MSLFSTLFNVGIARRVGLWALIQSLPDEDDLHQYIRAAYFAIAGVIIGSVLTGAAVSVGIISAYRLLLDAGWPQGQAVAATAAFTLVLILGCFGMAGRWFTQLASIKQETVRSKSTLTDLVSDAVHNVTEGFAEGLTGRPKSAQPLPSDRRIRLIN